MDNIENNLENRGVLKRERFVKIAERRVNQILENLNNLGKCSNKSNYEYTDDEVRRIFREIDRKLREVKLQFQGKTETRSKFKL